MLQGHLQVLLYRIPQIRNFYFGTLQTHPLYGILTSLLVLQIVTKKVAYIQK